MKQLYFALPALLLGLAAHAQTPGAGVGIGTTAPDPKAALDIQATGKGLLIPRMDSASRAGIGTPPDGLMVFQTDGRKGFWYAVGGAWVYIPDKTRSGDNLGNHQATQNLGLNDYDLRLRAATDTNHGLGWYGNGSSAKSWLGQNVDGPVLYGNGSGVLGTSTSGTRQSVLTWNNAGRVGIGRPDPQQQLHVAGNIAADGPLGVVLAAADRPLVTRGWDAFTSGIYQGLGRWGLFMEPNALTFGVPDIANKRFQWVRYGASSAVASTLMTLTPDGDLQLAGSYGYTAAQTRVQTLGVGAFSSNDPTVSQAVILFGSGPVPVGTTLTGSGQGTLLAPLKLPAGATLTNLEITVFDGDNSTAVTTQARVVGLAGNVGQANADAPSTGWVTVPQGNSVVVRGTGPVSLTTDANHAYFVEYQANRSGVLALLTVRVTYTVTEVE
ncbi:hypothetical protein [Hymenobacter edaphi]|uniref:Uncharacterized protein n=1 Tax=Hymenobacter edaphi TaxID=2211146 RepID=A0A328BDA6_9BACT|nr:hypothetical protein [Hymenobacter edaphi]RAK63836.1 hypothetical protein DLM85_20000 [Hymenobacter edaphi]